MWRYRLLWLVSIVYRRMPPTFGTGQLVSPPRVPPVGLRQYASGRVKSPARAAGSRRRGHPPNGPRGLRKPCLELLGPDRLANYSSGSILERVNFHNIERFAEARSYGKGVVLSSAHLGNLDFVLQTSLSLGLRFTVLAERLQPRALHDLNMNMRRALGLNFVTVGPKGIREAFSAVHRGDFACLAADRAIHGESIVTNFFGRPALMPTGAAELALRTGATVLPAHSVRTGRHAYDVYLDPPIPTEKDASPVQVRALTDRIIGIMERYIRAHPTQWMAFEPIWVRDRETALGANQPGLQQSVHSRSAPSRRERVV